MEMSESGVHVSALCPGFVFTEFHDVNGTRQAVNKLPGFMFMEADECADQAVQACELNRAVFIHGRVNKSLALLSRALPSRVAQNLMAKNSHRVRKD